MLNAKRPHFLQGFDPSSSSERLKIPFKFIKHMEGKASGPVSLVGPSGNTWHADLIQHNDGLFIHEGWAAFVRDHFLECGDCLVFRYDGNLIFTVQVFDQSSCEKEAAFSAEWLQDPSNFNKHMGKKRERENIASLDNIVKGVPKKIRSAQVHSECITKYRETNLEIADKQGCLREGVASMSERCEAVGFLNETEYHSSPLKTVVTLAMPSQSKVVCENSEAIINNSTIEEEELGSYARDCLPMLSAPEADRIARSFSSPFPNFTKVMKRFNISGSYTLNIPYQFSMAHLPKCRVQIVLHNIKGESWTINSIPTTKVQTSHTFCGGWLGFVRGNNINVGDICIFELVRKCELRVQILRVRTEGPVYEGVINACPVSSLKIPGGLPKKMRGNFQKVHLQRITKVEISDTKGSDHEELMVTKRSQEAAFSNDKAKTCNGKPLMRKKKGAEDKQGSPTKGCMSMKSAPEEKIAAQSFISTFPHFVRIMKKFNTSGSYTLKVPYQFSMEHLPNCRTEIVLRNIQGECWTVNSIPTTRVQTLHTFCGGWMAFVRGNDIQMGDICIFELVGKCEMRVHISGFGKKGQDYQSGKPASNEFAVGSLISNGPLLRDA